MSLLVLFVSGSNAVIDTITARRTSLVPNDIRSNSFAALNGEEIALSALKVSPKSVSKEVLNHIASLNIERKTGVILLTDNTLADLVNHFGDMFSVNIFVAPKYGQNVVNLLQAIIAKVIRTYKIYRTRFNDKKYQQILRLPMRNFTAVEIQELRVTCHDMMNRNNFGQELDGLLKRFRARQLPKKASAGPTTYIVDDDGKHFTLGNELHAQAETSIPPHNDLCILRNRFRFGRAFNGRIHYNVSRDNGDKMTGEYIDCHNSMRSNLVATHINMFTSDFF